MKKVLLASFILLPASAMAHHYDVTVCNNTDSAIKTVVKHSGGISSQVRKDFGYKSKYVTIPAKTCKAKSYSPKMGNPDVKLCVQNEGCVDVALAVYPGLGNPVGQDAHIKSNKFKVPNSAKLCCRGDSSINYFHQGFKIEINSSS